MRCSVRVDARASRMMRLPSPSIQSSAHRSHQVAVDDHEDQRECDEFISESESSWCEPRSEGDVLFEKFQRAQLRRRDELSGQIRKVLLTSGVSQTRLDSAFQGVMTVCCDALRDNNRGFFYDAVRDTVGQGHPGVVEHDE